ncbi:MAG TPA: HD domain-containing protein, partial [Membranihabitans sp.]|nr:HD domain-containing protein [Membranihabitans sp.]
MTVNTTYQQQVLPEVQEAFDGLLSSLEGKMTGEDRVQIQRAFEMANESHAHQKRKSGELYIFHPIEVARICVDEMGLGPTAVIAALLHDIVEDTNTTLEEIEEKFGKKVSLLVDGLTKLAKSYQTDVPQAENFRKVLTTLLFDVRVVLIK